MLQSFKCEACKSNNQPSVSNHKDNSHLPDCKDEISLNTIGVIKTMFLEKRAVPRQASEAARIISRIELNSRIFNNPEHSLEGLETFSHIWILYYFHRNQIHLKSKVAPPRLGGERVGVFSTRSPHRPCPIGLSLVQLDRIDNGTIYFYGTDMVDGTPVLDIKPYIPQYDVPRKIERQEFFSPREAPDGEENCESVKTASTSTSGNLVSNVTVPNWVTNCKYLSVTFNETAEQQLQELAVEKKSITEILRADPRSVYLRTKYGSQIYTFQLGENTVTCKFDDQNSIVNVLQVRKVVILGDIPVSDDE
ncbi:tRNA (adenine(37)-N6)-methyltransferase isoform X2 [Malaya genurostris]|nr:tRNA (adenine(37)-N6)-methyltransferase isoform X2 [Malaya genurostris]